LRCQILQAATSLEDKRRKRFLIQHPLLFFLGEGFLILSFSIKQCMLHKNVYKNQGGSIYVKIQVSKRRDHFIARRPGTRSNNRIKSRADPSNNVLRSPGHGTYQKLIWPCGTRKYLYKNHEPDNRCV